MDWKDGAAVKNDCYVDRGQDSASQHQCEEADNLFPLPFQQI